MVREHLSFSVVNVKEINSRTINHLLNQKL